MILLRITLFVTTLVVAIRLSEEQILRKNRQLPAFGRAMRQEFLMDPQFTLVNHGASGAFPRATRQALHEFIDRAESNPDIWVRRELREELRKVQELLAKLVKASADDIVMVINTTSAINAIFRSMKFAVGERILYFSTIFSSMEGIIRYICDLNNGGVTALKFSVTYPISNDQIVENLKIFLDETHDPVQPIRVALIDHITSVPGVIVPIERIIPLLKSRNITVIVDAAHAIGQIPINLTELQPDYYVTNCYKWLYTAKGSAMLYVDKKHQPTLHPAHINYAYTVPANYQNEFYWTGNMDYSPILTVTAALKFREDVGGEEAIMNYNHRLAIDGGTYLANLFGTEILQYLDQIGNMVDVRLPINNPNDGNLTPSFWSSSLFERFPHIFVPTNKIGDKWYIRVSAQIYNDLDDFEVLGNVFNTICNEINGNNSTGTIFVGHAAATAVAAYGAYRIF